ncbi:MAG: hypothetical protein GY906_23150 [bacterium]|nr:hypothetical protein [bacterium]
MSTTRLPYEVRKLHFHYNANGEAVQMGSTPVARFAKRQDAVNYVVSNAADPLNPSFTFRLTTIEA